MTLLNSRWRKTNLHEAWIDCKKAYDSLHHGWITRCLEIPVITLDSSFKQQCKWNTMLTVNGQVLGEVHIRRGVFQGDSLSSLLFVIAVIPLTIIPRKTGLGYQTSKMAAKISHQLYMEDLKFYNKTKTDLKSLLTTVRIFSNDISMEFGLEKCATLTIHREVKQTQAIYYLINKTLRGSA